MFFGFHAFHEVIVTPDHTIIFLDVAELSPNDYESAYATVDEEVFAERWRSMADEDDYEYTTDDIEEWAEELCEDEIWWTPIGNYRNPDKAERELRKYIKTNLK